MRESVVRRFVQILAIIALLFTVAGVAWVVYAYISISPDDEAILQCAQKRVAPLQTPPAPTTEKVQVGTKDEKVCTKIPGFRGLKVSFNNKCIVVAKTPIYESRAVTDLALTQWQATVAAATEAWRKEVEVAAEKCAEEARVKVRDEIKYWTSVMSGPAPYLLALVGFVGGMALTRKRRGAA